MLAFGGDVWCIEHVIGALCVARDNIATAFSELIDSGWLNLSDAKEIAKQWLYNNANDLYGLNLPAI